MSLAAGGTDAPMNPNVDVGGEGRVESRSGSAVSFADLDDANFDAETGTKKRKDPNKKPAESKVKDDDPKDADKAKGTDKKPEPKEKKEASSAGKEDNENKDADAAKEKKPKAKSHKFRHGETEGDISGDATFTIPVNGGKEDVSFQDLVNEYNGKKFYETQHGTLRSEKSKFEKERGDLNKTVADFAERAKKDPDGAWDFLAELNGANPIEFKENMLRTQIKAMEPLMAMAPEEREAWINQKKLEWREKIVASKEQRTGQQAASLAQQQERRQAQEKYGISDEDFQKHYDGVKQYLQGKEPTADQVAWASRAIVVSNAIKNAVPELANHKDRDRIVADLANDMVSNPKMTQASVEATLKQVFGEKNDGSLRKASKSANKNANYDADEPGSRPKPKTGKFESFSDLDD